MTQYLLSVYQPDGDPPPPEVLEPVMVAVLVRLLGDIDAAEEAVQDAFTEAVRRWPSRGLPPRPAGWIITTARNRAIDRYGREASRGDRHAEAALLHARDEPPEEGPVR